MPDETVNINTGKPKSFLNRSWYATRKNQWTLLLWLLKIVVIIISGWYLYVNLITGERFSGIYQLSEKILTNEKGYLLFGLAIVLTAVNWGIEAQKWRFVVGKFQRISFGRSIQAILSGAAISLWMPNRIGEYLGRIFYVNSKVRIKSMFATIIGSLSQLVVTLVLGALGFLYFEKLNAGNQFYWAIVCGTVLFIALVLFFFFNIRTVRSLLPAKKWAKPLRKYLKVYRQYNNSDLRVLLAYSLFRYLVYSSQFFIFMLFFGTRIPFIDAYMMIFLAYFIQTISPTSGLTELVVRGGTTVFLFGSYTTNVAGVLAATYSLWLINLLMPGLIGAIIFGFAKLAIRNKAA